MKKLKIIFTLLIFGISINSNAQFFKKLQDKAKQKIEREAEKRAQRRVDKKIDKTFDKAEKEIDKPFSKNDNKNIETNKKYNFSHIYAMQMTDHKGSLIEFEYYLKNNVNYLAVNFPNLKNKMISIMDLTNGKNISLMENDGQKTKMVMEFNFESTVQDANKDVTITKTGNTKKILNFNCYEYDIIGKDFNSKVWVTKEAGIKFPNDFQGSKVKKMKNQNNNWMFTMNGMVLEMTITDTSRKKPRISNMICTKLKKVPITLDTSLYNKMF